ncbi:MAG: prepilin-type N-terminal cleavage/methylation domain-containing protein [Patescibacteria group bacterium]
MNQSKKVYGFTLVEALVYISIFVIIIVFIIAFIFWLFQSYTKIKVTKEILDNAMRVMDTISYEIKGADNIYISTSNANQISLETKRYSSAEEETSYIDFYACEDKVCFKKESQNPFFLISDKLEVSNLSFTRVVTGGFESVKIDLTMNYKNPSGREEYESSITLSSNVSLR